MVVETRKQKTVRDDWFINQTAKDYGLDYDTVKDVYDKLEELIRDDT